MARAARHGDCHSPTPSWILSWVNDVASAETQAAAKRAAAAMSSPPRSPSPRKRQRRRHPETRPPHANPDTDNSPPAASSSSVSQHDPGNPTPAASSSSVARHDADETALTPRPARGRARDNTGAPLRATPPSARQSPSRRSASSLQSWSASSLASASSQRSRTSTSPRKRALALLQADDLPVVPRSMTEIHGSPGLGGATRRLLEDIARLRTRQGVLPGALKQHIQATTDPLLDPLGDYMFDTDQGPDEDDPVSAPAADTTLGAVLGSPASARLLALIFAHKHITEISAASRLCADSMRPVHEAEWNDRVHSRVLDLALRTASSLVYHNITAVSPAQDFRDPDPKLKDNKVDYGLFLAPPPGAPLKDAVDDFMRARRREQITAPDPRIDQVNVLQHFEPDRPMAVAIETKRGRGADAHAPNQLSNWARIHFRHLRALLATNSGGAPRGDDEVLTLPLIEVDGARWNLKIALYQPSTLPDVSGPGAYGTVLVYDGLPLGSTESITDCYTLVRALRRLATWCEGAYTQAWERTLGAGARRPPIPP